MPNGLWQAFAWYDGNTRALGELPEPGAQSEAADVNEAGKIVGIVRLPQGAVVGVLWDGTRTVDLGSLGMKETVPRAINQSGQVVGWSRRADGARRAFLWSAGKMTELTMLSAAPNSAGARGSKEEVSTGTRETAVTSAGSKGAVGTAAVGGRAEAQGTASIGANAQGSQSVAADTSQLRESLAYDINDRGDIVGACQDPTGRWHAVLWRAGKPMVVSPVGKQPGTGEQAKDVSSSRTIRSASRSESGRVSASGSVSAQGSASARDSQFGSSVANWARACATAISANGEIVGWYEASGGFSRAFLYSGGKSVDISPPQAIRSEALGINARSVIVGRALFPAGGAQRELGVVWLGREASILNSLLVEQASIGSGVVAAVAISESGLIAANMINPDGTLRGVILKPYAGH
jgi:probable HAF family extracellular repeat protein